MGFVPSGFVEPSPTKVGCAKGAALLSTDLVKVRELLSFPFRTPTVKKTFGTEKEREKTDHFWSVLFAQLANVASLM